MDADSPPRFGLTILLPKDDDSHTVWYNARHKVVTASGQGWSRVGKFV